MKNYRISEILYIVIALISVKEAYVLWEIRPNKAYLFWVLPFWPYLCISLEVIIARNLIVVSPKWK